MASFEVLETTKARALAESVTKLNELTWGNSSRLFEAQYDVVGRNDPLFVSSVLIAELIGVVADLQDRVSELEQQPRKRGRANAAGRA
jgi:hypothetical protein